MPVCAGFSLMSAQAKFMILLEKVTLCAGCAGFFGIGGPKTEKTRRGEEGRQVGINARFGDVLFQKHRHIDTY